MTLNLLEMSKLKVLICSRILSHIKDPPFDQVLSQGPPSEKNCAFRCFITETCDYNSHTFCHCVAFGWNCSENKSYPFFAGEPLEPPQGHPGGGGGRPHCSRKQEGFPHCFGVTLKKKKYYFHFNFTAKDDIVSCGSDCIYCI